MGTQFNFEGASQTNMKACIVLFALVAAAMAEAEAEADPAVFYAGAYGGFPYGYGLSGYAGYAGYPYTYGYGLPYAAYAYTGCHNDAGAAVPCAAHNVVKIAKREAEAEAEADPAVFYAGAYGGFPYGYGLSGYAGYAGYPYTYGYGLPAYTYAAGCRNNNGALVPCAHGAVAAHVVAKREADSEADPAYFVSPYLAQYGFPRTFYGHGLVHTSRLGVCTNYLGAQVPC